MFSFSLDFPWIAVAKAVYGAVKRQVVTASLVR